MFGHMFPYDRFAQFWLCVHLVDVINCAKFHLNRLRVLDSVRGQSLPLP